MRTAGMSRWWGGGLRVGVLALAAVTLTGDASSEPAADRAAGTQWVSASTGLMTLRPGRAIRLSTVEVDGARSSREVRLSIIDGKRRVLRETVEQLTPGAPVFLDLGRNEVPPGTDPPGLPIRAEWKFVCPVDDSGPVTSVEIFNVVTGEAEVSSACGCPCCNHTGSTGVMTDCGGGFRVGNLTSAP